MSKLNMNLSDKLSVSGGREIGRSLEECYLLLMQHNARKPNALTATVMARIEKTLDARKGK